MSKKLTIEQENEQLKAMLKEAKFKMKSLSDKNEKLERKHLKDKTANENLRKELKKSAKENRVVKGTRTVTVKPVLGYRFSV